MRKDILNNRIVAEDMPRIFDSVVNPRILMGDSIYITGATGMIGSYLTAFLIWLNEERSYNINIFISVRNIEKAKIFLGVSVKKIIFIS